MDAASEEERLLEFLYAAPVGLVEIDASGAISMINPYAMKHLLPLAGQRGASNLFTMLEGSAPEIRNLFENFGNDRGTICDGHRIMVDLLRPQGGADPKVLACTLVKINKNRSIACISDVSLQVVQERRLKQAETWFSTLVNDINDYAIMSVTAEGIIEGVTPSWRDKTGYPDYPVIGQTLADVEPYSDAPDYGAMVERLRLARRDGWHLDEVWRRRRDGSRFWCQRLLAARIDGHGEFAGFTVVLRDIAPPLYQIDDLRRMLTQDHLTGAANRARFQDLFERERQVWLNSGAPLSLIMIDIDHFKRVNDTYGHHAGDLVLSCFAGTIAKALRPTDVFARLGGEEFAVLLANTSLAEAEVTAERLRRLTAEMRIPTEHGELKITASLGCATAMPNLDLLRSADSALYAAKQNGRNRVHSTKFVPVAA